MQVVLAEVVASLPAVGTGIVSFTGTTSRLRTWVSVGPDAVAVGRAQERADRSPAVATLQHWPAPISGHLRSDPRWALDPSTVPTSVHTVAATPLPGTDRNPAVLCVYGPDDALLTTAAADDLHGLVPDVAAAVCVVQARLEVADLQAALTTNRTIGAAIGITMAAHRLTYDQAAGLLKSVSNTTNTRLADVADDILLTGLAPDPGSIPPSRAKPSPSTRNRLRARDGDGAH
ncbi:ANTAR domain-containing protein [Klenkia sp. PcliD-1-E]|uniref:ANTAR domain-containing protein n=1 Tax=Klenkia sp. PcliD-1-E TaxID=2954492 RepID=UPI0020977358|nr:ANTAR domain-containing protein [Klenkia sp. PcliD-1-E]MCO7220918.1 ANTAR domain-containing protein [Klenkia sp. PcliD-1-E]